MRKALVWFAILALLIVVVRIVKAQAIEALGNHCSPAIVEWKQDSLEVFSVGCVDFRRDSLIIIPHLIGGNAIGAVIVQKPQVRKVTLLREGESATLNPP